jgi:hypothetical protein
LKQRLLELHGLLGQQLGIIRHLMSFLDYGRVSRILLQLCKKKRESGNTLPGNPLLRPQSVSNHKIYIKNLK